MSRHRLAPAFLKALTLRDELVSLGWRDDLIAIEAWGMDISKGMLPKGYRVVLAWADGRLKRVSTLAEAQRFLTDATTGGIAPLEAPGGAPDLTRVGEHRVGASPASTPPFSGTCAQASDNQKARCRAKALDGDQGIAPPAARVDTGMGTTPVLLAEKPPQSEATRVR